MVRFRPLPVMTAALAPALAALVGLGLWQLERAGDKRELLIAFERMATSRVVWPDLTGALCEGPADPVGGIVEVPAGVFGGPLRFYGARGDGPPGWRLVRLALVEACFGPRGGRFVVVETGFETLRGERLGAPERLSLAAPPRPSVFAPRNRPASGAFHRFDRAELASAFDVPAGAIRGDVWAPAFVEGLPPAIADMPPARHVGYALTWFGLGAALLGVYGAFHVRAGRLGWGTKS
ncbi:MAG: hypothetical protein MI723_17975 [Caulobacterales bacterium]|nr:hypothetical protein [Caulobacterales bacterium]